MQAAAVYQGRALRAAMQGPRYTARLLAMVARPGIDEEPETDQGRLATVVHASSPVVHERSAVIHERSWVIYPGSWVVHESSWVLHEGSWKAHAGSWMVSAGS